MDFTLPGVPPGKYARLRFHIGLPANLNYADAAQHPADHPLNPQMNGLHWSWLGGYVFLALEGSWKVANSAISGYSHHLATDRQFMTVELPVALDLTADQALTLAFDVGKIFAQIALTAETATTHSREGDPLAEALRRNVERAFAVLAIKPAQNPAAPVAARSVVMNPRAKLRPFTLPKTFPRPTLPGDNPLTEEGIALGDALFHDTRLSINGTQSCASCHVEANAFSDPRRVSMGAEGRPGARNAMPLFNLAWKREFFWDGRAKSLREQVLEPIQNPDELHETLPGVVAKLAADPQARASFHAVFGSDEITADRIARALEQFLLTRTAFDSKFDRAMQGDAKLTAEEQRGFDLFHTEYDPARGRLGADCFHCHGGANFQKSPSRTMASTPPPPTADARR